MTFGQAIALGGSKLVDFSGRSTRAEFWWMILFLEMLALGSDIGLYVGEALHHDTGNQYVSWVMQCLFTLAGIPIAARRLHDTGRSGWWQLLALTVIGLIPLIIWLATESESKKNRFGPSSRKA